MRQIFQNKCRNFPENGSMQGPEFSLPSLSLLGLPLRQQMYRSWYLPQSIQLIKSSSESGISGQVQLTFLSQTSSSESESESQQLHLGRVVRIFIGSCIFLHLKNLSPLALTIISESEQQQTGMQGFLFSISSVGIPSEPPFCFVGLLPLFSGNTP